MRVHLFWLLLIGCGGSNGNLGDACSDEQPCNDGLACAGAPLPGGYCSVDCSSTPCPDGETCAEVGGFTICLKPCAGGGDCRDGYQCFQGSCRLACSADADCGTGFHCDNGTCTPYDGAPIGGACSVDTDCSSRTCLHGACAQACTRDAQCAGTCGLNAQDDKVQPACTTRRGSGAPGAACTKDAECDRGTCQLGACVELCDTTPDCHGSSMVCEDLYAVLADASTASFKGCLPRSGTLSFDGSSGVMPLPRNAQAFAIYTALDTFDFNSFIGVTSLVSPSGATLYAPPNTVDDFYALPLRYAPSESTSTLLAPNAPGLTLVPGAYQVGVQAQPLLAAMHTRFYVKLGDAPIASGHVNLNFYVTDLSAACLTVTAATGPTLLAGDIQQIKQIFAQASITIDQVTFKDVAGANVVKVSVNTNQAVPPDLDNVLQAATANKGTQPGLDIVLVRAITDPNGNQSGVLGIAGGIPSSPILGTPHSGAVVSIQNNCNQTLLGPVAAHELGHTLGLYHSIEQDGHTDPLSDTSADGTQNLMYWAESAGDHVTAQQAQVLRNDPKVHP